MTWERYWNECKAAQGRTAPDGRPPSRSLSFPNRTTLQRKISPSPAQKRHENCTGATSERHRNDRETKHERHRNDEGGHLVVPKSNDKATRFIVVSVAFRKETTLQRDMPSFPSRSHNRTSLPRDISPFPSRSEMERDISSFPLRSETERPRTELHRRFRSVPPPKSGHVPSCETKQEREQNRTGTTTEPHRNDNGTISERRVQTVKGRLRNDERAVRGRGRLRQPDADRGHFRPPEAWRNSPPQRNEPQPIGSAFRSCLLFRFRPKTNI